jgi:hypothetical protein
MYYKIDGSLTQAVPLMVENAGITNPNEQLLINAINPIFSMMGAIYFSIGLVVARCYWAV